MKPTKKTPRRRWHEWRFGERQGRMVMIVCATCGVPVEVPIVTWKELEDPEGFIAGECGEW